MLIRYPWVRRDHCPTIESSPTKLPSPLPPSVFVLHFLPRNRWEAGNVWNPLQSHHAKQIVSTSNPPGWQLPLILDPLIPQCFSPLILGQRVYSHSFFNNVFVVARIPDACSQSRGGGVSLHSSGYNGQVKMREEKKVHPFGHWIQEPQPHVWN